MKKTYLILLVVALLLIHPEVTLACVCELPDRVLSAEEVTALITQRLHGATAVFSGRVVEADTFKVKFKVDKQWKGHTTEEITLLTGAVKNTDGTLSSSTCDYGFRLGDSYLVYASGNTDGLRTHKCSGTNLIKYAEKEIEKLDKIKAEEGEAQAASHITGRDPYQGWRDLTADAPDADGLAFYLLP